MKDKRVLVLTALLIACMIVACGNAKTETNITETNETETKNTENSNVQTRTIVFPDRFEHLSSMNEEKLADFFKDRGEEHYCDLSVEDGLLKMSVTEEQIEYWKEYTIGQLEKQESVLTAVSPKYSADFNEKHDTITAYYDAMLPSDDAFNYVGRAAMFCAMYQLFDGAEDFSISLYVYNLDTGKLVTGGNLEEDDVSYENSDWIKSYTLNTAEAEELATSIDSNNEVTDYDVIKIKSTFIDGMSVIDILQSAGGNDYLYIYLDEDDAVILCMLTQLLKGDGESFYIDITIYDSSTGEVVSSGNTVDGITWNIGE